jgi:hypothetical protein
LIKSTFSLNVLGADDVALCREALDVLALAVALFPQSLDNLCKDKSWQTFIIDLVLFSPDPEIRLNASDQFLLIATRYKHLTFIKSSVRAQSIAKSVSIAELNFKIMVFFDKY